MQSKIIKFIADTKGGFQAIFKNNHGRLVYLNIKISGGECYLVDCFYLDRSNRPRPKKLIMRKWKKEALKDVLMNDLDTEPFRIVFDDSIITPFEDFIKQKISNEKYRILLFLQEGNTLKTVFKNRIHRSIYLEIAHDHDMYRIVDCRYCDKRTQVKVIIPHGLITFSFEKDLKKLLFVVNSELEGGFTDIAVTNENTIILDRPICGYL